jgi:hypothetical protein
MPNRFKRIRMDATSGSFFSRVHRPHCLRPDKTPQQFSIYPVGLLPTSNNRVSIPATRASGTELVTLLGHLCMDQSQHVALPRSEPSTESRLRGLSSTSLPGKSSRCGQG